MLSQSTGSSHFLPAVHAGHAPPPQSGDDSLPFWTLSLQVGSAQTLAGAAQYPLAQSSARAHDLPIAHFAPVHAPPQSTSVSVPFFTRSLQSAGWHVVEHTAVEQSAEPLQGLPAGHLGQEPPPQSTPVSEPFLARSSHE